MHPSSHEKHGLYDVILDVVCFFGCCPDRVDLFSRKVLGRWNEEDADFVVKSNSMTGTMKRRGRWLLLLLVVVLDEAVSCEEVGNGSWRVGRLHHYLVLVG